MENPLVLIPATLLIPGILKCKLVEVIRLSAMLFFDILLPSSMTKISNVDYKSF